MQINWYTPDNKPDIYKHVLLLVLIEYSLNNKHYEERAIIEGYYHKDGVYCDFSGDTINGDSTVIGWYDLPNKFLEI